MPPLSRRFKKLKSILNSRMDNLTVVLEEVHKPHNLSAILRSCDAVGVLEAHTIYKNTNNIPTFNSTAQGSQKWVELNKHKDIESAVEFLKCKGFKLYGTNIDKDSYDYRDCDFSRPTAFFLGAEKWGLTKKAISLMDESIYIPMNGMVQSLNVSVAAAILLFEALRQREALCLVPKNGEGLEKALYNKKIFEWTYPKIAALFKEKNIEYPKLNKEGQIIGELPKLI